MNSMDLFLDMHPKYSRVEDEEAFIFPRKLMFTESSYGSLKTTWFYYGCIKYPM